MMHAVKGAEFEFFFVEKFQFLGFWKKFYYGFGGILVQLWIYWLRKLKVE